MYKVQVTSAWCHQLQEEPGEGQVKPTPLLLQVHLCFVAKPSGRGAPDQKKLRGHKRQGSAIASAELCFQQQQLLEKENLLYRLTVWDDASCYDLISYWIPFCFPVCQPGSPQPSNSHLLSGRSGKDRVNKAESMRWTHPQSTLEKRGHLLGMLLLCTTSSVPTHVTNSAYTICSHTEHSQLCPQVTIALWVSA